MKVFVIFAVVILSCVSAWSDTVYVKIDSPADGPGTTWDNAFHTIQGGIDVAKSGDTVLVNIGIYDTGTTVTPGYSALNRIVITNDIIVRSEYGPSWTSITGAEAPGGGNAASNLVDGNPNTMWHTMYSVTVAQYPHWVEFDSGEVKTIKGCSYTPRQGGNNGDVKKYTIHVSLDGKKWGKPIHKGKFKRSKKEQRIIFSKPVKARFVRFTAISSQNGQDFASGAEFSLFAK